MSTALTVNFKKAFDLFARALPANLRQATYLQETGDAYASSVLASRATLTELIRRMNPRQLLAAGGAVVLGASKAFLGLEVGVIYTAGGAVLAVGAGVGYGLHKAGASDLVVDALFEAQNLSEFPISAPRGITDNDEAKGVPAGYRKQGWKVISE